MAAMLERADQVKAAEMLEMAQIIQMAVAAGVASVTPVPRKARRHVRRVLKDYEQLLAGLHARATGTVGERVDARGRGILRSVAQVRQYLEEAWRV